MSDNGVFPIPPGLWCGPSALVAITGEDPVSVIQPAINRTQKECAILEMVTGTYTTAAYAVLEELGYNVRRYKHEKSHIVATWAKWSKEKYPNRKLLLTISHHMLVAFNGRIYDNWTPHGPVGENHPYAHFTVTSAVLVEKKRG